MRTFAKLGVVACLVAAGCGGISNEELQMLALLPDGTLAVETPADQGQALTSEEYATNEAALGDRIFVLKNAARIAAGMNAFAAATLEHLEEVSQRRPTSRDGSQRTWGPVALKNGKGFVRVTLQPDPTATCPGETSTAEDGRLRMRFSIELSGKKDKDFKGMVSGVAHGDHFDASCGSMHFDRKIYKAFGGTGGLADPDGVDLAWERTADTQTLTATVDGAKTGDLVGGRVYHYVRHVASGAGEFRFSHAERIDADATDDAVEVALQWAARGHAGRADFRVERSRAGLLTGTACWNGSDAPYYADSDGRLQAGIAACGDFAPLPLP